MDDVRRAAGPLVGPGPEVRSLKAGLERFLHEHVYRHHRVMRMANKGRRFLRAVPVAGTVALAWAWIISIPRPLRGMVLSWSIRRPAILWRRLNIRSLC